MKRVALLIGISQHEAGEDEDPGLPPLPTAKQDVSAIAQVLQHPEQGGFAPADVQQLIDPDLQSIRCGLEVLLRDRQPEDLVLLYFSGHAIADSTGSLYFATKNTTCKHLTNTAIAAEFLQALLYTSVAQQQIIILDCYFSGGTGLVDVKQQLGGYGKAILTASTTFQSLNRWGDRIAHPNPAINCLDYSAKQHHLGLSIYTGYFIEGIETGAGDLNRDGTISLEELHHYASQKVQILAPALQPAIYALPEIGAVALGKAPKDNPRLTYQLAVENFLGRSGGTLSLLSLRSLEIRRESLGISATDALILQENALKPYRHYKTKLQLYKTVVRSVMQLQDLPLSPEIEQDLQHLRRDILGLGDLDVRVIEEPLYPSELEKSFPTLMVAWASITLILVFGSYSIYKYLTNPVPSPAISTWLEAIPIPSFSRTTPDPSPEPEPESPTQSETKPGRPQNKRVRPLPPRPQAVPFQVPTQDPMVLTGHVGPVQGLAIDPQGQLLISGSWDNTLNIWDLETGVVRETLRSESPSVIRDVALDPYSQRIASARDDGTIEIWQLDRQGSDLNVALEQRIAAHFGPVYAIAISPDGLTLASGSQDNTIKIWAIETGDLLHTLTDHQGPVRSLAITPDGQTLISGAGDATIKIWNLETGELQNTLTDHTRLVRGLAIAPDGKTLASASWDRTLKIWDLTTGELRNTLIGHTDSVVSVAISPDGSTLVSGSDDDTIKLWDLTTGEERATFTNHRSDVFSLVFSLNGKTLVSASWDQTIQVWRSP
ncbi:caspase family protein [Laspinema sp. A4]|uniref:caspase family protein n=1 Tax=Laspinema sp. D2d TaxID=2953686 RepID=UPI0021BB1A8B|nr:caspase family protein [Laspinema sp. D2d]MCT7981870.1 caspase family protein [Laspinema sp. D2d]